MRYNKLVRDKVPEIIAKENKKPIIHQANPKEYSQKLREKLSEEVQEFLESGSAEELADILEVLYALLEEQKISRGQLEQLRKQKEQERGNFSKKLILERVE